MSTSEFSAHMAHQHAQLGDFIALLEDERRLLKDAPIDITTLSDLTERKQVAALDLDCLEHTRCKLAQAAGHASDLESGQALAEKLDCAQLWSEFRARVVAARDINQANGALINTRINQTDRTLGFLDRASANALYAPDGQRASSPGRRISSGA